VWACLPLLAPGGAAGGTLAHSAQTAIELSTVVQINAVRGAHGLPPLQFSPGLLAAAVLHDRQMVQGGYFDHRGPDGSDFFSRIGAYYPPGGHVFYAVGENILYTQGQASSTAMVSRWMGSAEHRANILSPQWRQVGVAVLTVPSAPGVFGGLPVTVVTVDFGVRK
jgi:uncharacterized protein YkwD